MIVIDGNGMVVGRVASQVAKKLLEGEEVHIINAEKMLMTGKLQGVAENYRIRRRLQNKGTPEHSPVWPKVPSMLVRRIVRGMLPWKSARGRAAFKRLRVYISNPKNFDKFVNLDNAKPLNAVKMLLVSELCKEIGYVE